MAKTFQVDIVSAEAAIFSGEATMLIAPGESGRKRSRCKLGFTFFAGTCEERQSAQP